MSVILQGLPGLESFAYLFRELRGIARRFEHFPGHQSSNLMIAVPVTRTAHKDRGDHQRTNLPHDSYYISKNPLFGPFRERLAHGLRKSVIANAGEILIDAVILIGGQEFFGSDQAERIPKV